MSKKQTTDTKALRKEQERQQAVATNWQDPFDEMEQWFENRFPAGWMRRFRRGGPAWDEFPMPFGGRTPSVDVIDRDSEILVRAELPGVDKKDLDVSLTEDTVSIKGSTQHEEKEEKGDYYRRETSSGSFTRTVALPSDIDSANVKATFKDGVLELKLPKQKASKRHKVSVD